VSSEELNPTKNGPAGAVLKLGSGFWDFATTATRPIASGQASTIPEFELANPGSRELVLAFVTGRFLEVRDLLLQQPWPLLFAVAAQESLDISAVCDGVSDVCADAAGAAIAVIFSQPNMHPAPATQRLRSEASIHCITFVKEKRRIRRKSNLRPRGLSSFDLTWWSGEPLAYDFNHLWSSGESTKSYFFLALPRATLPMRTSSCTLASDNEDLGQ
jgi:hypothetical protein